MQVDPYDPAFQRDPFPVFAQLRRSDPVHFVPEQGWYMVTAMELVREALRHPETYANSDVAAVRRTEPPAEIADEIAAIRAQGFPYTPALSLNDPPIHTRYRKLISRAFTPRALAYMEEVVESVAAELVGGLADGATVDIIDALARPLPVYAIVRILGLPDARRSDIARWSDAASASLGRRLADDEWLASERDNVDFQLAMAAELDERRDDPRDDLLSVLVAPTPGEQPLTNGELVFLIRELLVAGNETTTRSIAEAVVQLDRKHELWSRVRADSSVADAVAEEAIRLASPVLGMFRRVTHDTVLGGTALPKGSIVYLGYGAASRDPGLFTDPDEFAPGRDHARDHLAFGFGIHVCVGTGLARMETSVAVRALADAVNRLAVIGPDDLSYVPSFFLHGLSSVPVRVTRLVDSAATGG